MTTALERLSSGYYNSAAKTPTNPGGFANNGHRTNLPALIDDVAAVINDEVLGAVSDVVAAAAAAAASAASALNAPGTIATSNSNVLLAAGVRVWDVGAGKLFSRGQTIVAADQANAANRAVGRVDSLVGGLLTVEVATVEGPDAGTSKAAWDIALTLTGGIPITRKVLAAGLATQSGDGSLSSDVTITVPKADLATVRGKTDDTKALTTKSVIDNNAQTPVAWASTLNLALTDGGRRRVTTLGNTVIANPTGMSDGDTIELEITVGGAGGWTLGFANAWDFKRDGAPTPSTVVGKVDLLVGVYSLATGKWSATYRAAA